MSTKRKTARQSVPVANAAASPANALVPARRDGWTAERQAAFLRNLASTHDVSAAAKSVGMTRQSAYKLRARLRGEPFDMAWDAAFQGAFDALAEAAMDRALNGIEVPHYYKGELVGTSRRFDERLTVALLAMRHHFLREPASSLRDAGGYEPDDVVGLTGRVEDGPERWSDSINEDAHWED